MKWGQPFWASNIEAVGAASLLGLVIGLAGIGGVDDAAHRYQASVFSVDGWTAWDNYWYAGRYDLVNYSVLYYPLAAALGQATVAVGAVIGCAAGIQISVAEGGLEWRRNPFL